MRGEVSGEGDFVGSVKNKKAIVSFLLYPKQGRLKTLCKKKNVMGSQKNSDCLCRFYFCISRVSQNELRKKDYVIICGVLTTVQRKKSKQGVFAP